MMGEDVRAVAGATEAVATGRAGAASASDQRLRDACCEFEGMLTGMILKQGMKPGVFSDEESASGGVLREFAVEQTAAQLGRTSTFGIADLLYEQMVGKVQ